MRSIILIAITAVVSYALFLKRDTKVVKVEVPTIVEVEVPVLVEVVRTKTIIEYVDRPIIVRPPPVLVMPNINWNDKMLNGVKFFEGYRETAYVCSGGVKTIGYGCTDTKVVARGKISETRAEQLLRQHLVEVRKKVTDAVTVDLTEYQLNALTSFAYNCGMSNLKRLVEGEGRLNSGNYKSVECLLPQYRIAGGKVREGLERRRTWELSLWKGTPGI